MSNPHDRLVKHILSDLDEARAFLAGALAPGVVAALDLGTLAAVSSDLVDQLLDERHGDLLFTVERRGGGRMVLHVLVEHQSTRDVRMAYRLLRYVLRIWEHHRGEAPTGPLPPVLAVVLYHGEEAWTVSRRLRDLIDLEGLPAEVVEELPDLRYRVIDLSQLPEEALFGAAQGRLMLLLLKHVHDGDLWERLPRWGAALRAVRQSPHGLGALSAVLSYIVDTMPAPPSARVQRFLREEVGEPTMKAVMSWGDQLRAEGIALGEQRGIALGEQRVLEELRRSLLAAGTPRLGSPEATIRTAVEAATLPQVVAWFTRLPDVASWSELVVEH